MNSVPIKPRYDGKVIPDEQTAEPIQSSQTDIHADLLRILDRHLRTPWRKPIPDHTQTAGQKLLEWLALQDKPLLLDSFCGTGQSTAVLAERHPDLAVVGVDKSAARLSRHAVEGNYLLLRAECEPLWQLLQFSGVRVAKHYLLYPNPWPKPGHLKRRIHGHPAFGALLGLGGHVELRSNWSIYVREFATAMKHTGVDGETMAITPETPITLFEAKYRQRGQTLWRWKGKLA
jgi:tRNA G46 methylase TrmB